MAKNRAPAPERADPVVDPVAAWPFPKAKPAKEAARDHEQQEASAATRVDAPARIRAEQINLYTDPALNVVERIALDNLQESPFNPRTRYDQKSLEDLAETIRGVGVMQPLLVRRLSVDGLLAFNKEHRGDDAPRPEFEIVFGHRRARAARLAGEPHVPAIVRELTDTQAAQLQAIENVQRKDLDPIEEAQGYQRYIDAHRVTKDQLAAEIGLSRSHVYGRLKLLNAVPTVRDACAAGEIGSEVALLVARIHSPKLQEKALAALKGKYYDLEDGGQKSYRQIREFLKEKYTLDLKKALFDPKDAQLLPDAGACTGCPKRSANAPEYQDLTTERQTGWRQPVRGEADLCTDPDCFDAKKRAHLALEAGKLAAKGKTVVEGAKARAAIGADGKVKGAYVAVKDVKALLKKAKDAKPVATVVIQDPRTGDTVEAVKREDLKAAGVKEEPKRAGGGRHDYEAERKKREEEDARRRAQAAQDTRVHLAVLAAVRKAAAGQPLADSVMRLIVAAAVRGVEYGDRGLLAQLHECKTAEQLQKKLGQLPPERLTTLLLDCVLVTNVKVNPWRPEQPEALLAAAKHYGVDVAEIRNTVAAMPADPHTADLLNDDTEEED